MGVGGESVRLSVVIPAYNEEANIRRVYDKLASVLEGLEASYEIILVDDGSTDETYLEMEKILAEEPRAVLVRLRRNFGQSAALAAGFDQARGEIIIAMDGDLQHDPKDIPALLAKMEEGYDVVSGWRKVRVDNFLSRRLPSLVANQIMKWLSGVRLHDFGTTLKAYRREVIKGVSLYGELHRFIPVLASRMGIIVAEVPIKNSVRTCGRSKYNLLRTFRVLFDFLTVKFLISYLTRPMHLFGLAGLLCSGLGAGLLLWLGLAGGGLTGFLGHLVLAGVFLVLGLQFFALGLLAEVSSRIYFEGQDKRIYAVRETKSRRAAEPSVIELKKARK